VVVGRPSWVVGPDCTRHRTKRHYCYFYFLTGGEGRLSSRS
jgi:hypothetical protein